MTDALNRIFEARDAFGKIPPDEESRWEDALDVLLAAIDAARPVSPSEGAKRQIARLTGEKFIVRLWDGMDGEWMDVSGAVDENQAMAIWDEKTAYGTKASSFEQIDYYRIFEAGTKMTFSEGRSMTR